MYKWIGVILLIFTLVGCSNSGMGSGDPKPPNASIKIGDKTYETKLGTYCWNKNGKGICVDSAGPVEMLKDQKPIVVKPGDKIKFIMDYEPKPNEIDVQQINGEKETEVVVKDNQFNAPTEKGIYYYSYGVWWNNEKEENVSDGDAFYAFVLEVK